jgi:hypothetical protein
MFWHNNLKTSYEFNVNKSNENWKKVAKHKTNKHELRNENLKKIM